MFRDQMLIYTDSSGVVLYIFLLQIEGKNAQFSDEQDDL